MPAHGPARAAGEGEDGCDEEGGADQDADNAERGERTAGVRLILKRGARRTGGGLERAGRDGASGSGSVVGHAADLVVAVRVLVRLCGDGVVVVIVALRRGLRLRVGGRGRGVVLSSVCGLRLCAGGLSRFVLGEE